MLAPYENFSAHCMSYLYMTLCYFYAVLDFGANGDGVTDNVKSFQNSLNAANAGGIGIAVVWSRDTL